MISFCGGIEYETPSEMGTPGWSVGSDLCYNCQGHQPLEPLTQDHRRLLHQALDEWLDKSNGTGSFWVGNPWHDSKVQF
jgi:hypothetical protein